MSSQEFQNCPGCGRSFKPAGSQRICLYCGSEVPPAPIQAAPPIPQQAPARPGTRMPVPPQPAASPFSAPPPPPAAPGGSQFPERMRANKALVGRVCMGCNKAVELGENIWNCQTCGTTMHQACYDSARSCLNMQCPTREKSTAAPRSGTSVYGGPSTGAAALTGASGNPNEKPCPYCGEKILTSAKKCRFCGEYLNAADRKLNDARKKSSASDENLTGGEILLCVLCAGIACIIGLIWMAQGKKKGGKMVAISLIVIVITNVIRAALGR